MFPDLLNGYKTYLAGAGMMGLALFQFSQGDVPGAAQSFLAGLAALGLRHAIAKTAPVSGVAVVLLVLLLAPLEVRAQEVAKPVLDRIRAVSVSIEADADGFVSGSGTLFDKDDETWCITARHVVRAGKGVVRVSQCRGDKLVSVYADIAREDERLDLVLLRLGKGVFGPGTRFARCTPDLDTPLVHCGSMNGHHHTVTRGYLVGLNQEFLSGQRRHLADFTGYHGSSGGGVFTAQGDYAGMVVGGIAGRLVYFVPGRQIHEVLQRP